MPHPNTATFPGENQRSMPVIKTVREFTPQFGTDCYLADNATISALRDNDESGFTLGLDAGYSMGGTDLVFGYTVYETDFRLFSVGLNWSF